MSWNRYVVAAILAVELVVLGLVAFLGGEPSADGLVTRPGAVVLDVQNQDGPWETVIVRRVVALTPSWVMVQARSASGGPTDIIGYAPVPAGASTDVAVALDPAKGDINTMVVSVLADRGRRGILEYTAPAATGGGSMGMAVATEQSGASTPATPSIDKPFVADGKLVAVTLNETYREGAPGVVHRVALR